MFLADFHVHSNFSDGKLSIAEVVDLYGQHGFGAIAITDHLCESQGVIGIASAYLGCSLTPETFPEYLATIQEEGERAWRQYGMRVLPGYELTKNTLSNHRSAHVVAVGVTDYVRADGDVVDLAREVRAQGAIAIAAHPVWTRKIEKQTYYLWDNREELAREFDAWEIASGPWLYEEVLKTRLPKIANSDLHQARHLSAWKTQLDCERHPEAILDAVRRQRVDFRYYNAHRCETSLSQPPPTLKLAASDSLR